VVELWELEEADELGVLDVAPAGMVRQLLDPLAIKQFCESLILPYTIVEQSCLPYKYAITYGYVSVAMYPYPVISLPFGSFRPLPVKS